MNIIRCERVMNYGTSKSYRFRRSPKHISSLFENESPCYANGSSDSERAVVLTTEEQKKLDIDVYFSDIYGYKGWTNDFEMKENERIFIYKIENEQIVPKLSDSESDWKAWYLKTGKPDKTCCN